jgi:soluble lytic murein transglycosylase-like protein
MKLKLLAGLSAAFLATAALVVNTQAAREFADYDSRVTVIKKTVVKKTVSKKKYVKKTKKQRQAKSYKAGKRKAVRTASIRKAKGKKIRSKADLAGRVPKGRGHVVAMIKSQAPRYGVPAWFALRIARVESGYNPRARGAAGEYGVFQMKCQTARGLGFRGPCGNLLNASTNVRWGLRHLQLAVRSSRGNLRLAASKHNGGLGRKSLVRQYVNRVF